MQAALRGPDRAIALEVVRSLIERVVLHPTPESRRGFEIELVGAIAAMLDLGREQAGRSQGRTREEGDRDLFDRSIKVVAGTGFEPAGWGASGALRPSKGTTYGTQRPAGRAPWITGVRKRVSGVPRSDLLGRIAVLRPPVLGTDGSQFMAIVQCGADPGRPGVNRLVWCPTGVPLSISRRLGTPRWT